MFGICTVFRSVWCLNYAKRFNISEDINYFRFDMDWFKISDILCFGKGEAYSHLLETVQNVITSEPLKSLDLKPDLVSFSQNLPNMF
jgi:hypothetical protein